MARVAVFVPDLLFGSNVIGALRAAGHEPELVSDPPTVDPESFDVLVLDLTADARERLRLANAPALQKLPTLAFYAHVETDVRELAQSAGIELVVPRSRMAREGPQLVERLSG